MARSFRRGHVSKDLAETDKQKEIEATEKGVGWLVGSVCELDPQS